MYKIEVNGVSIVLTPEQLAQIDKQRSHITYFTQIDSYETACKVLNKEIDEKADCVTKLRIISKAINSLIIVNDKFPNWKNNNQKKYYPIFTSAGGSDGLVFDVSRYCHGYSNSAVGFFKLEEASNYMGKTFLHLYKEMLEEEM